MSSRRSDSPYDPGGAGDTEAREAPSVPERHERTFMCDGHRWHVYEHARAFDRRSRPDLVFESEAVVRRVRNYPTNWLALDDGALCEVCRRR